MIKIKKLVALLSLSALLSTSVAFAQTTEPCNSGCGYEASRSAPCLTPEIALGAIGTAALIAILIHNRSSHSGSHHAHCVVGNNVPLI